jgi:HlyD family secretion protein
MKTKTWLTAAGAAVVLAAVLAWAFAPRPLEVEVASVTQGRFESTVDEDGKTRLRDRYVVSAPLAGRLARITLREGDAVDAGAVVAQLMPVLSPLLDERSRREQVSRVEGALAQVQMAVARIERAKVAQAQASAERRRSEQLAKQGFVSPTKLETDALSEQAASKELDAAVQARHVAEHELETTREALKRVQATGSASGIGFAVRSPVAGRVLKVMQTSEAVVTLGTPLLELGDTARLEIVAELLTTDALQTPPGAPVRIERWGGPGTLEGRVRQVDPAAFTKVSALGVEEQRVNVVIDITSPPERWQALGDGYRVSVRIVSLAADEAVQVPVSAVFPQAGAEKPSTMAAFVVEGGRARRVAVTLAARGNATAWVKEGLKPGDMVIVYPGSAVNDGVRVTVRRV